jgi:hypothetical protein
MYNSLFSQKLTNILSVYSLVCADLKGQFDQLFAKVNELSKSSAGPFDFLLCIGRFFSPTGNEIEPYLKGEKKGPL